MSHAAHAAHLWSTWLGPKGSRPPPLDRFLSGALRGNPDGREISAWVFATAARAVTSWCAVTERPPEDLPTEPERLVEVLRTTDPGALVSISGQLAEVGRAPKPIWRRAQPALDELRARTDLVGRLVASGIPPGWAPWLGPRLEQLGSDGSRWLAAQVVRPPLWGRPARNEPIADVADALRAEGLQVAILGEALRIEGRRALRSTKAWRDGRVEIQDLASQEVAGLLDVRPGQRVWDACAGRGGKTVQIARALGGRGVAWASDTDPDALDELRQRLRRAGWADSVRVVAWDGVAPPDWGREGRGGPDRVLVDAPCGASGTWRRNPDAKLRPPPGDPTRWAETQRQLLLTALGAVRPDGLVVYATCSVLAAEDEDVVASVGDRADVVAAGLHGCPTLDSDTMFAAVLRPR